MKRVGGGLGAQNEQTLGGAGETKEQEMKGRRGGGIRSRDSSEEVGAPYL